MENSIFPSFSALESFFLPTHVYHTDNIDRPTAIMTVRAVLIALPVMTVFLAAMILVETSWFDANGKATVIPAVSFGIIAFIITLYLIRADRLKTGMSVITLSGTVIIMGLVFFNGGIFKSAATPLLVVLPVTYFCLINTRTGIWGTFLVPLIVILIELGLSQVGLKFLDLTSEASAAFNSSIANFVAYVLVCAVVFSLVKTIKLLQAELVEERGLLVELANRDPLTGLFNRRAFYSQLNEMYQAALDDNRSLAVFMIDLDDFKLINDQYGHQAGDAILTEIAKRLSIFGDQQMCAARLGGDEFALAADTLSGEKIAEQMAQSIIDIINCPIVIEGKLFTISASVGHSLYTESTSELARILDDADAAMYKKKYAKRAIEHSNLRVG